MSDTLDAHDTPRCNNHFNDGRHSTLFGDVEFARTLERELATLRVTHAEHLARTNKLWELNRALGFDRRRLDALQEAAPIAFWRGSKADGTPLYEINAMNLDGDEVGDEIGRNIASADSLRAATDLAMIRNFEPQPEE